MHRRKVRHSNRRNRQLEVGKSDPSESLEEERPPRTRHVCQFTVVRLPRCTSAPTGAQFASNKRFSMNTEAPGIFRFSDATTFSGL